MARGIGITMPEYAGRIREGRCGYCGAFEGPGHKCPDKIMDEVVAGWEAEDLGD